MATLLLLRHAKAEAGGASDHSRPLSLPGREQARRVAEHLTGGLIPDVVLCSDALRTRQTWAGVARGLVTAGAAGADSTSGTSPTGGAGEPRVEFLPELYGAGPRAVIEAVRDYGRGGVVLVVGHEPTMSMTGLQLAGPDAAPAAADQVRAGISTGTLLVIDVPGEWADLEADTPTRLARLLRTGH